MQAVDGCSSMLHSGAGLLRKAEVDAHRKVAIQVPHSTMLLSRNSCVISCKLHDSKVEQHWQ